MSLEKVVPTTVGAPVVSTHQSNIDSPEEQDRSSGYACTVTYTNSTPYHINLTERNGFSVTIRNTSKTNTGEFCVYIRYRLGPKVNINPTSLLNAAEKDLKDDLKAIRLYLLKDADEDKRMFTEGVKSFQLVYKIPTELIDQYNGMLNIAQLGLTISVLNESAIVVNPDSEYGKYMLGDTIGDIPGFNIRFEINDPERIFGIRYINISGRVFRINSTIDKTKKEGVYVYSSNPELKPTKHSTGRYEFYEAEEALKFYKTYDEAKHYGDAAGERDRDYEQLKHQMKVEALEVETDRSNQKGNIDFMNTFLAKLNQFEENSRKNSESFVEAQRKLEEQREADRKARREEDREDRRRQQEEEAHARKERLEYLKWITAGASAIGAGILAYNKLFK